MTSTTAAQAATPIMTIVTSTYESLRGMFDYPPLTTPYVFPTDRACDSMWKLTSTDDDDYIYSDFVTSDHEHESYESCQPSEAVRKHGRVGIMRRYHFSPAVCPESWTYWDLGPDLFRTGQITATCCAPEFTLTNIHSQPHVSSCIREYTGLDDFTGVPPSSLPSSMSNGFQVHEPWVVMWQTQDTEVLPAYITEYEFGDKYDWWHPEEDGSKKESNASEGPELSKNMVILISCLASLVGLTFLFIFIRVCLDCRRVRRQERQEARSRDELESGEQSAYQETQANHSQQEWPTSQQVQRPRLTARVEPSPRPQPQPQSQPQAEERPEEPEIQVAPPYREPTPPPPYIAKEQRTSGSSE